MSLISRVLRLDSEVVAALACGDGEAIEFAFDVVILGVEVVVDFGEEGFVLVYFGAVVFIEFYQWSCGG